MTEPSIDQIPAPAAVTKGSLTHTLDVRSAQQLVDAIVAARDSARGRLHLLSLDARVQWQDLESQLDCVQSRIEYEGTRIRPSAAGKVRELIESVAAFLYQHANSGAVLVSLVHSAN